jgi:putative hemolysin
VAAQRDFDEFDAACDHLLVLDTNLPAGPSQVIATYRLLRRAPMEMIGRFYTQDEYNIDAIVDSEGELLELGRSCVQEEYRSRAAMQLLWRGIAAYIHNHKVKLLFGCPSFTGIDFKEHAIALSYLYHYHLAPEEIRPVALPDQYVDMNLLPKEEVDHKEALRYLPTLIKGYMRLGGFFGDGAVLDPICNTTDVSVVIKTDLVTDKYIQRYAGSVNFE